MSASFTNRRTFMKTLGLATAVAAPLPSLWADQQPPAAPSSKLPRWRGFNLQYFYHPNALETPNEDHFRWIADWGFDFVRLPMHYHAWLKKKPGPGEKISAQDVYQIDEATLASIDQAIEYGNKHHIHVCLCFHHAPGYHIGISRESEEPFLLWRDQAAVDAFTYHWDLFSKRYKDIDRSKISFNLFNEAPWPNDDCNGQVYRDAVAPAVAAIKKQNPDRIIIADGMGAGNLYVPELVSLGIAQSIHCYIPGILSHYKVDWMENRQVWPEPAWPGVVDDGGIPWSAARMKQFYAPWKNLIAQGVGVHMGETGASHRLPHSVFIAWLSDVLEVCGELGIGYSLWDFIGASKFGILDSQRSDVAYEDWHGQKLDRKMLELLQKY